MANHVVTLKLFQRQTLERLRTFCDDLSPTADIPRVFSSVGGEEVYQHPPLLDAPSVCLAVPTGGGKTIMAASACGIITQHALRRSPAVIIWLVPSTTIAHQTIHQLRTPTHPVQHALTIGMDGFGGLGAVRVLTIAQALRLPPSIYHATTVIIVATIQQFRIADPEGRHVYAPNDIVSDENATTLVEVIAARRPLVIVDEAHNARTPLFFDSLARLQPSFLLELTATPKRGAWSSNVLVRVDATALKTEHLLKLPLILTTSPDPERCLAAAIKKRKELDLLAHEESGNYVRPIVLIQAQPRRQTHALTVDVVREHLIALGENPKSIAIATGDQRELDDIIISAQDCPITTIITVDALREGWDCPFASVLCTLRQQFSSTAATQLVGRILRQPYGQPFQQDDLNKSFAFAVASSFDEALFALRGCLIDGLGFGKEAAQQAIISQANSKTTIFTAPEPPFLVPRIFVKSVIDPKQCEPFSDTHRLASDWELPHDSALLAPGEYIPGDATAQASALDVDDDGDWYATPQSPMADPLPLASQAALCSWLERRLAADDIRPDELQRWIATSINHLLNQRSLELVALDHDRWQLAHLLRHRLQTIRQQSQRTITDRLLSKNNMISSQPAEHFRFSTYVTSGETTPEFSKHLYPLIAPFDSLEEKRAALFIDKHPRIKRWVRNPVGMHGFALPRRPLAGRSWYYPDFIAELSDGPLLLIEVKGSHLADTIDATDKIDAARIWTEITGHGFVMVVGNDIDAISEVLSQGQ